MLFIRNDSTDPYFNMAAEEFLVKQLQEDAFMLWRNDNTIVIGRNQNTMAEINYDYVRKNSISVVRRMSGGGAVFHDMGNINFTFVVNSGDDFSNYQKFTEPVIGFLRSLGAEAELRGRNDLVIEDKKISGNAQYMYKNRMLHHGTLLYNAEQNHLAEALRVSEDKIKSKGIQSVRSRVTNILPYLKEPLSPEDFIARFADYMVQNFPDCRFYDLSVHEAEIRKLRDEKYATWEWNFGTSPAYAYQKRLRFPFGSVELYMDIGKESVIDDVKIFGDFFSKCPIGELEAKLCGMPHKQDVLQENLQQLPLGDYIQGMTDEDMMKLLF
ncbi:MAG: lipoate--protein ligase [Ruminococcaceae bacterium]|nr:lipoate--protein ligase [Oscillospiraceae bacterium]